MKHYFTKIFTILIFASLIFLFLRKIDFQEVYTYLKVLNPLYFFLAFSAYVFYFLIWTFRGKFFFDKIFKVKYFFLLKVFLAGAFFNTITPGAGVGGQPFMAYFVGKKYKKSKNKSLGVILGDRFFHLLIFALLIIFSILFILIYMNIPSNIKLILEAVLVSVLLAVFLTIFFILKKFNFNFGIFFKQMYFFKFIKKRFKSQKYFENYVNKKIKEFIGIFRKIVKDKKNIFIGILSAFFIWLLEFFVSYFLFLAFDVHVNFLIVVIVVTLGILFGSFSLLPSGVGVVESTMLLLYSLTQVNFAAAFLVAFLSRLLYYFFSLFFGGISLIYLRATLNK